MRNLKHCDLLVCQYSKLMMRHLFSLALWLVFTTGIVFAQIDSTQNNFPCTSLSQTPSYLKTFLKWSQSKVDGKTIALKTSDIGKNVIALLQFKDFNLKPLNSFLRLREKKRNAGILNGFLKITGTCEEPMITGKIKLSNGFVKLSNFGKQSLVSVVVDTVTFAETVNRFQSLKMNVDIKVGKDFYVQNKQFLPLNIEFAGSLHLIKEAGQEVQLTGKLSAVDGFTKPLGKRFRLTEGTLTYKGGVDDPNIHLRSVYEPHRAEQDVKIWYIVEGTIRDPAFKFKSTPFMEPKNIISYTLFGQPFYQLDSIEQNLVNSVVGYSTADRTTEVLLNRAEAIATQKLSVDVVRIDNTNAESGTVITTGWYINPRVFFAIQNVIAARPRIGFYLEYYLTEDLKLILSQDDDYGQGVDLQYEYDY